MSRIFKERTIWVAFFLIFAGFLAWVTVSAQDKPEKLMLKAVYVMFPDKTVKHISPTPGEGFYSTACIHPEGKDVVFGGGARGYARIWKYDCAKDKTIPITPDSFVSVQPSYSWDGSLIAFAGDKGLDQKRYDMYEIGRSLDVNYGFVGGIPDALNLFVMDADGTNIRQITRGDFRDARPAFSPDGTKIVFHSDRGGGKKDGIFRMWVVASDGSGEPQPLQMEVFGGRPWYSVDGKLIYFFTDVKGRHTLCKMPAEGGDWEPLPNDTVGLSSHGPYADPDGKHLWYHCYVDGLWCVYILPLDGGEPVRFIPPGFKDANIAHATRACNGCIAFDSRSYIK
ncbi:TolB family protein [Acidobacteriota bacterium]